MLRKFLNECGATAFVDNFLKEELTSLEDIADLDKAHSQLRDMGLTLKAVNAVAKQIKQLTEVGAQIKEETPIEEVDEGTDGNLLEPTPQTKKDQTVSSFAGSISKSNFGSHNKRWNWKNSHTKWRILAVWNEEEIEARPLKPTTTETLT